MIRPVIALALALLVGGGLAACGPGSVGTPKADTPKTNFEAKFSQVGESLRVAWSVTNTDNRPILVFDGIQPVDGVFDPDAGNGAFVTGRPDGTVEIAMRAFAVPEDLEAPQAYVFRTNLLAPGASRGGNLIVLLPLRHRAPPTGKRGDDILPTDPQRAVFCLGVMAADGDLASRARDPEHPVLPHAQEVVDAQTLLCSDPIPLAG